jgi:hypothetical protein
MRRTRLIAAAAAVLLVTGASAASASAVGGGNGGKGGASVGAHPSGKGKGGDGKKGHPGKGEVCTVVIGGKGGESGKATGGVGGKDGGKATGGKAGKVGKGGKGGGVVIVDKGSWQPPFDARDLAKALRISPAKAKAVYAALGKLAHGPRGTIDEHSAGFAKVAAMAGVSPQQLDKVLFTLKMAAGEKMCRPAGKGKPGKPGDPGKGGDSGKDGGSTKASAAALKS